MFVDRFYNAQSASSWIYSDAETGLEGPGFATGMRIVHGPSGCCVKFPKNTDGTFANRIRTI
ncbi:hypothetical protein ACVDFE_17700 [Lentzea chajnantorensis]